jgi:hypothetical protein
MGLEDRGYLCIRGLLDQSVTELLFQYMLLKHQAGAMDAPDELVQTAPRVYGDPLTETLLLMGQSNVEQIVGAPVWPSYSYARIHGNGASMPIHQDREASEIGVTIYAGGDVLWPLWFRTSAGDVAITLSPGDGIVYYGQKIPHWREPFAGSLSVQCMLFYVRQDGPCAKHRFDGRLGVGSDQIVAGPDRSYDET